MVQSRAAGEVLRTVFVCWLEENDLKASWIELKSALGWICAGKLFAVALHSPTL